VVRDLDLLPCAVRGPGVRESGPWQIAPYHASKRRPIIDQQKPHPERSPRPVPYGSGGVHGNHMAERRLTATGRTPKGRDTRC
jgi:hypothetical protein